MPEIVHFVLLALFEDLIEFALPVEFAEEASGPGGHLAELPFDLQVLIVTLFFVMVAVVEVDKSHSIASSTTTDVLHYKFWPALLTKNFDIFDLDLFAFFIETTFLLQVDNLQVDVYPCAFFLVVEQLFKLVNILYVLVRVLLLGEIEVYRPILVQIEPFFLNFLVELSVVVGLLLALHRVLPPDMLPGLFLLFRELIGLGHGETAIHLAGWDFCEYDPHIKIFTFLSILTMLIKSKLQARNMNRSNPPEHRGTSRKAPIKGIDGSEYYVDTSLLILRDPQMSAIYWGRRVRTVVRQHRDNIGQNSIEQQIVESRVYVKQYSSLISKQQVMQEWQKIQLVKGYKMQNLFIDLITDYSTSRYYLVLEPFKGTLENQFKRNLYQFVNAQEKQKKLQNFCLDFAFMIHKAHYELNSNKHGKLHLILTTLEPIYIATETYYLNSTGTFLLSLANAIPCSSQDAISFTPKGESVLYYAPQMRMGRISLKSNIWSFGCILYQLLAGQKFMLSQLYYFKVAQEDILASYVEKRLRMLRFKLLFTQKPCFSWIKYWLKILEGCLQVDPKNRWNSQELCSKLQTLTTDKDTEGLNELTRKQRESELCYYVSFQHCRISMIHFKLMVLIELADQVSTVHKYLIYIVVKFASYFAAELYSKSKETINSFTKIFKAEINAHIIVGEDDKKFKYIRDNITHNITRSMQKEIQNYTHKMSAQQAKSLQNSQALQDDIANCFPEYADSKLADPRRLLHEFCFKYSGQLCKDQRVRQTIAELLLYTRSLLDVSEMSYHQTDLSSNIEAFTIKKLNNFIQNCEDQSKTGFCKVYTELLGGYIRDNVSKRMAGNGSFKLKL